MLPVAVAVVCKTPQAGHSKTRLTPPLTPAQCARLSAAFIRDVTQTMNEVAAGSSYAIYTPVGSEEALAPLLPKGFRTMAQSEGDLGTRLIRMTRDLFIAGHRGVVLVNADSPTLPHTILRDAIAMTGHTDNVVVAPAHDGGYTLVGLTQPHDALFTDIAWSTSRVYEQTRARALQLRLPVVELPLWYDVDDAQDLAMLERELGGTPPPFAAKGIVGAPALHTRQCLAEFAAERSSHAPVNVVRR
jgi:rSAM/selenodomain-associated transferase 1